MSDGFIYLRDEVDSIFTNLDNEDIFITHSKTIAEHLFEAIKGDKQISRSDLIICLYRDNNNLDAKEIAILKMDPH